MPLNSRAYLAAQDMCFITILHKVPGMSKDFSKTIIKDFRKNQNLKSVKKTEG
jgi:hypothetical protein